MKLVGWILMAGGILSIVGYIAYFYIRDFLRLSQIPLFWRIAPTVVFLGILLIIIGVIYDRISGRDQYQEED